MDHEAVVEQLFMRQRSAQVVSDVGEKTMHARFGDAVADQRVDRATEQAERWIVITLQFELGLGGRQRVDRQHGAHEREEPGGRAGLPMQRDAGVFR